MAPIPTTVQILMVIDNGIYLLNLDIPSYIMSVLKLKISFYIYLYLQIYFTMSCLDICSDISKDIFLYEAFVVFKKPKKQTNKSEYL